MPRFWYEIAHSDNDFETETVQAKGHCTAADQGKANSKVWSYLQIAQQQRKSVTGLKSIAGEWGYLCIPHPRYRDEEES